MINDGYLIILFDLPVQTKNDRNKYTKFRKNLLKNAYIMLHKSIYYKYIRELKNIDHEINIICKNCPNNGDVKMLKLTKKQFKSIESIIGKEIEDNTFIDYVEY